MNTNDKQLKLIGVNVFKKIFNKIRKFFFRIDNKISVADDKNVESEPQTEVFDTKEIIKDIGLNEKLQGLESEYQNLLEEREKKLEELEKIVIKDLKITLRIHELAEKELLEIKELLLEELNELENT